MRKQLLRASHLAPGLVARLAEARLFSPLRGRPPTAETEALGTADRFTVGLGEDRLVAWSWQAVSAENRSPTDARPPTVLLVHGWAGRGGQLAPLAPALTARGWRVVTFDAPGHGASTGRRSSLPMIADAIAEIAAWVGGIDAVVGHSAGAPATTLAIDRGLIVRRAIFLAPVDDISALTEQHAIATGLTRDVIARIRTRSERWLGTPWSALRTSSMAVFRRLPLLIIHDVDDREVPPTHSRRISQAWSGAERTTTRGLGHRRILRDAAVIDRVSSFVAGANAQTSDLDRSLRQRDAV